MDHEESDNFRQCSNDRRGAYLRPRRSTGRAADRGARQGQWQKLAAGYRASKVIGSSVTNDANETIGKIDDLLVSSDGKDPFAVLSIGGFLGVGSHLVAVPYDSLKFVDKKFVLPGGTKEGLKMLPEFKYASE
jgi:hypothetical protein